jgi:hypothetical protein
MAPARIRYFRQHHRAIYLCRRHGTAGQLVARLWPLHRLQGRSLVCALLERRQQVRTRCLPYGVQQECHRAGGSRLPVPKVRPGGADHHPNGEELLGVDEPQDWLPAEQCRCVSCRLAQRSMVPAIHGCSPEHPHVQLPVWILPPHQGNEEDDLFVHR